MQDSSPAWTRLGDALIRRRIEMDPRYRNRRRFVDERGAEYRTVSDIEKGRGRNFEPATIIAVESTYRLAPGAIRRYLNGAPELEPAPGTPGAPAPDEPGAGEPAAGPPADTTADEMVAAVLQLAASRAEAAIAAEIAAHPEGAPAEEIFSDEVEVAIWNQRTKTSAEKVRMIAAFRAAIRANVTRQVS
jgi:hypothetical protein